MKRLLLVILLLSVGIVAQANDCKIKEITPKAESNNFTLENILEKDLKVFTANPVKTLIGGPILIFENKKHIGFQRIKEDFYTQNTLEKSFQKQSVSCQSDTPYFVKNGYSFLLKTVEPLPSDDRKTISVFIIPDKKQATDYFYLVSFVGFDQDDVIQMLIKNK